MPAIFLEFDTRAQMTKPKKPQKDFVDKYAGMTRDSISATPQEIERPLPIYLSAAAIVVTLIFGFMGATHVVDTDINSQIGPLQTRMTRAEDALKVLASLQSQQTQALIQQLLASAQTAKNPGSAAKVTLQAAELTTTLRTQKSPAPPDFFEQSLDALNHIGEQQNPNIVRVRMALAEYRSALETAPADLKKRDVVTAKSTIRGPVRAATLSSLVPKGTLMIANPAPIAEWTFSRFHKSFTDLNIVAEHGGSQVLDGIHWHHITFIGAHIIYDGGDLDLEDVRFVNCTFEVHPHAEAPLRTVKLLDYAILREGHLSFGSAQVG